jgi:hypothetical protein
MDEAKYKDKEINAHKQDRHVGLTKAHEIAVDNAAKSMRIPPSTFPDRKTAERYIDDVSKTGDPSDRPNRLEKTYQNLVGKDSSGRPLYKVKVQYSKTGKHGWPSGDGNPGTASNPNDMSSDS